MGVNVKGTLDLTEQLLPLLADGEALQGVLVPFTNTCSLPCSLLRFPVRNCSLMLLN